LLSKEIITQYSIIQCTHNYSTNQRFRMSHKCGISPVSLAQCSWLERVLSGTMIAVQSVAGR
jgi:hypothetical protein